MKTNNIVMGVLLLIVLVLLCKPCMCNENYIHECDVECGLVINYDEKVRCYDKCTARECNKKCSSLSGREKEICLFDCSLS